MNRSTGTTPDQQLSRVLRPPSGWTLEPFCRLDESSPGLLRFATSSRPEWRHSVALSLANGLLDHPDRFLFGATGEPAGETWASILAQVAALLPQLSPAAIIEVSFGACPEGLVSSLRKLKFEPLSREAFLALHAIHADPAQLVRRRALMQLSQLDPGLFEALCVLEPALLTPALAYRAKTGRGAERINRLTAAVRRHCSMATDQALTKSLSDLGPDTSLESWARSWLLRADQNVPAPPWRGNEAIIPLATGELLAQAARTTRTCIRSRILQVLAGRAAYYLDQKSKLIACVVKTTSGWIASEVVAEGNRFVGRRERDQMFDLLEEAGILCFRPVACDDLEEQVGHPHFGLGEFDLGHRHDDLDDEGP